MSHVWTFTVPRAGFVLVRATGAIRTGPTPIALTNAAGKSVIANLATQSSTDNFGSGTYATATKRLHAGTYALAGTPLKHLSIRVDLIPDAVTVQNGSVARDGQGRTRAIGEIINGTTATRAGMRVHVLFRNRRGAVLGRATIATVLDRVPPGGTDLVAALVKPPRGTTGIAMSMASSGSRSAAVPGGLRAAADIDIDCTAPAGSGFCEAETAPRAFVANVSGVARHGIVVAVAKRDHLGHLDEVDIATVPVLGPGTNVYWGGLDANQPWLPLDITTLGPIATDTGGGAMSAYAQATR